MVIEKNTIKIIKVKETKKKINIYTFLIPLSHLTFHLLSEEMSLNALKFLTEMKVFAVF